MGLQGARETWGAGRGRKDKNSRDGRCRTAVVDSYTGVQATQDWKRRGRIGCKKSGAAQSKGGGWGGKKDTEVDGKRSSKQLKGGTGFR